MIPKSVICYETTFHTHCWTGPRRARVGTPRLEQKRDYHWETENRSSFVRRLMWLRKSKGFQVSVLEGFPLGSITVISWSSMDSWVLFTQGLGSRSWIVVVLMDGCVWKTNCWIILWLFDFPVLVVQDSQFLMICLDSVRCDGDKTARESPGWGRSWIRTLVL